MGFGYQLTFLEWAGERLFNDADRGAEIEVLLYDDSEDDPQPGDGLAAIQTEPTGLARPTVGFGTVTVVPDTAMVDVEFGDVVFDLTDVSGTVDALGYVAELDMGTGLEPVLIGTGPLESRLDLSEYSGSWSVEAGATLTPLY